jgi:hypothetical protein
VDIYLAALSSSWYVTDYGGLDASCFVWMKQFQVLSHVTFCCSVLPWFFPFILQAAQSSSSVNMVEVWLGWQQRIITQLKDGRFVVVVRLY